VSKEGVDSLRDPCRLDSLALAVQRKDSLAKEAFDSLRDPCRLDSLALSVLRKDSLAKEAFDSLRDPSRLDSLALAVLRKDSLAKAASRLNSVSKEGVDSLFLACPFPWVTGTCCISSGTPLLYDGRL